MAKAPLSETVNSLRRVQEFDAAALSRTADFGTALNFANAVKPAQRLIDLFKLVPVSSLEEVPEGNLGQIRGQADNIFNLFSQIQGFKSEEGNPAQFRVQIAQQITDAYNPAFTTLLPYIGYAAARASDFQRLETEGRAAVQSIADRTAELMESLNATKKQAEEALNAAQRAALEQGVSQQAIYFKEESDFHDSASKDWQKYTTILAIVLAAYAAISVLVHKWEFLKPTSVFESTQLITSKILIFAVISYVLILAAKNFLSHKHNAIVNKHRQNALMTFNALAEAAKDQAAKDIILTHAASCIFAPQETGYAKSTSGPDPGIARSVMTLAAKADTRSGVS